MAPCAVNRTPHPTSEFVYAIAAGVARLLKPMLTTITPTMTQPALLESLMSILE